MAREWKLSKDLFDALLVWLDPDRELAACKYEEIRSRLIRIFKSRGSPVAEDLADETFDRVARKLDEIAGSFSGDPALYFYGVGHRHHFLLLRFFNGHSKSSGKRSSGPGKTREEIFLDPLPSVYYTYR